MVRYEIKKLWSGNGGTIALLLLIATLLVEMYFTITMTCCQVDGDTVREIRSIRSGQILHEMSEPWEGYLDEERIAACIEENLRIEEQYGAVHDQNVDQNLAYAMKQGFEDIRELINFSFGPGFRSYDYYTADTISPDRASEFYSNRVRLLEEWLYGEADSSFSDTEKEYLISQFKKTETPFYYERFNGWQQLFTYLPGLIMISTIILGYLVSRLFAGEFAWKADAIFFSSAYGRSKAIAAKIKTGILTVTAVYFAEILILTGAALLTYGASGWNCPIQVTFGGWKSLYNITVGQEYFLIMFGGYIGCLFLSLLVMLVSAMTNSIAASAMIPFIVIFLPSFLPDIGNRVFNQVIGLWPDQLLSMETTLRIFQLYPVGGKTVPSVPILNIIYAVISLILPCFVYSIYRRKKAG